MENRSSRPLQEPGGGVLPPSVDGAHVAVDHRPIRDFQRPWSMIARSLRPARAAVAASPARRECPDTRALASPARAASALRVRATSRLSSRPHPAEAIDAAEERPLLEARGGAPRFERADDAFYDHLHSEGLLDLPQQWLRAAKERVGAATAGLSFRAGLNLRGGFGGRRPPDGEVGG